MKLVIVESPTKCLTIQKYLGDEYTVKASLGHIRDLATSGKGGLGVDVEHGFTPSYIINKDKYTVVNELKALTKKADEVILATDPDREGEAISWHLAQVLGLDVKTNKRLEFHEITRDSISKAMDNPRTIDLNLVSSQETRRIVDRILGFKLSSLLYKRIHSRSAGRVQSATLKLIADHDEEIAKFVPEEYWNILVSVLVNSREVKVSYRGKDNKETTVKSGEEAHAIIANLVSPMEVAEVKKSVKSIESREPFTTSTMQQEAFAKLKFKTKKTQFIAQSLYEGINVGGEHVGLITYMRTDSARLAPVYVNHANAFIAEKFGREYLGHIKKGKASLLSQDAHEAIRPTSNHRTPESVKPYLTADQYNLYRLIYNRTLSSLMAPKKVEACQVTLKSGDYFFTFELGRTLFKGFEIIYKDNENEKDYFGELPAIQKGDKFPIAKKECEQKFTTPPTPYSEAKIVKLMEEVGIGRPSTYSSTIETLKKRKYVEDKAGYLVTTEQGKKTTKVLDKYFPEIVNTKYTANMEEQLDEVQAGTDSRLEMLTRFYDEFTDLLTRASEKMYKDEETPTGKACPQCGAPLVYKIGRNGRFVGCSNYPACKYVEKEEKPKAVETGELCPLCGKPLVQRKNKSGLTFIGCSGYPECHYIVTTKKPVEEDTGRLCPTCKTGHLIKKKGKYGYFLGCSNYPTCNYMEKIHKGKRK